MAGQPPATTKMQLLRTAEKLFAREGIDAVSMRTICTEAGQRNNAALQYHFGDKQNLIAAILEERMKAIEVDRASTLERILGEKREDDLHELVGALIGPFTAHLCDEKGGGRDYVRFVAQLFSRGNPIELLAARRSWADSFHAIIELVRARLSALPEDVVAGRIAMLAAQMVHATAARGAELAEAKGQERERRVAIFTTDLIDYMVGGLTARVSPARLERELQA
ncbi:MAG: TetR/AcrR family transcriptional regulator [bacterium]|nr:TetR/AcrR family transcriptional regulator [bacterium]